MSQTDEDVENLSDLQYDPEEDDEEEEIEEEEEGDEEEPSIYDSETFISGPFRSEHCTIQEEILVFDFSYGYDCRRYFNLVSIDPDTLVFASGNFINFFNVETKAITFRRSALGRGIGHIKNNPNPEINHLAIAENGEIPLIIIYEWPTLEINCVLKGGSSALYTYLDYSPDGMLLVSQGGEPDYLITIWDWPKHKILLRTKSSANDVYRVKFSPDVPGQLTSCGIAHVKFWKMARTFTGLKLKGELGRFGKTEISDILGVLPMPDEKVVSGSSWGNILVWDAELIKLEVFRSLRRKCHEAPIVQLYYKEGELWTVSMDGHVKVWWYEKIDQADPPDEDRVIQMEPSYDFHTPGVMLMCLKKRYPDPENSQFFGQDGNGGIWLIDLNQEDTPQEAAQLYKCHAGKVVDIAACPWATYLVSLGQDGRIFVYDYIDRHISFYYQFPASGVCLIWPSVKVCRSGDELIIGFDDGTLRVCTLTGLNTGDIHLVVSQIVKPHAKPITAVSLSPNGQTLITGSEDATIFIFQVTSNESNIVLTPVGYVPVANYVTCLTWHYHLDDVIIVGCLRGEIVQFEIPHEPQYVDSVSYKLDLSVKNFRFQTYKSQIRRDIIVREIEAKKAAKVERKREEMEKIRKDNPGLDIDEEVFLADSESEEDLGPLYFPEIPNPVKWMQSTVEGRIWVSMGGYDAGYIYEYEIDQKDEIPIWFKMLDDADDTEVNSYVYNHNKRYLIFAMQNGEIRVNKLKEGLGHRDLSDYWSLPMHDNLNGFVPKLCFSFDEQYFFSCGYDGNVFSYRFQPEDSEYIPVSISVSKMSRFLPPVAVPDETHYETLSLEQTELKKEQDRIDALANARKEDYRAKLNILRRKFAQISERNRKLKATQVIPNEDLELDPRVTCHINKKLDEKLALVKRKLAYDVEKSEVGMMKLRNFLTDPLDFFPFVVSGINNDITLSLIRNRKISELHDEMLQSVEEELRMEEIKGKLPDRVVPPPKQVKKRVKPEQLLEYFLLTLPPEVIEERLGPKLMRLLCKYRDRKLKWEKREDEWEEFMNRKPVPGMNNARDTAELEQAKQTIGDFKLKSDPMYKAPKEMRESKVKKYKQLLLVRKHQFDVRYEFNKKLEDLRNEKVRVFRDIQYLQKQLERVHSEIPEDFIRTGLAIEEPKLEEQFPETVLELDAKLSVGKSRLLVTQSSNRIITREYVPYDESLLEDCVIPDHKFIREGKSNNSKLLNDNFEIWLQSSSNNLKSTPWEAELQIKKSERLLYEQDDIIDKIESLVEHFNDKLSKLAEEKQLVKRDGRLLDLFILNLNQELIVLKNFESLEDDLQTVVNNKIMEVLDMKDYIAELQKKIENNIEEIEDMNVQTKSIQDSFAKATNENKFSDFLRKVFKKKYRPPKIRTGDESSSESSSSSSSSEEDDADDAASIDSRDFGIIALDLNVCPKGCEQTLYDLTVNLRSQRHKIEMKIKERYAMIEMLKRELEIQNKKIKASEQSLQNSQEELEKYQREKQFHLNEIKTTLILKLDRFQNLTESGEMTKITDSLVFTRENVSKLYRRVDELRYETSLQRKKHGVDMRHLTRMKTDCNFMKKSITSLQGDIVSLMKIKFGRVLDINKVEEEMLKRTFGKDNINELEEVLMKKLIHNLRVDISDVKGIYLKEIRECRKSIQVAKQLYTETLHENTDRHQLLTIMIKERSDLLRCVRQQEKKKETLERHAANDKYYELEIDRLARVIAGQEAQLQELRDEIKVLKTKGLPPKPLTEEAVVKKKKKIKKWTTVDETDEESEDQERDEEESLEDVTEPVPEDLELPLSITEESQECVERILKEMMQSLNLKLSKRSTENFIRDTVNSLICRVSVMDILQDLVANLPIGDPSDQQIEIIEGAAQKLHAAVDAEAALEDLKECASAGMIDEEIDRILLEEKDPNEMMVKLVSRLVDQLPIEVLQEEQNLQLIVSKISLSASSREFHSKEVMSKMESDDAKEIFNEILERVFNMQ